MDARELEEQRIANSFRPNSRPILIAIGVNLAMGILLLGVPYWRGRSLALAERPAFAHFTQCLLGGDPSPEPGLGIPEREREHFASNVLFAPSDWPVRCRGSLHQLAPPDAIFLWPAVKEAGVDLRAIVKLFDHELVMLHRSRSLGGGRVSSRPLLALAKLQAGLTLMAKAAGVEADIDNYALRFRRPALLADPARLPLMAAETATLDLRSVAGSLEALAVDSRGTSWLRVDAGKIDRDRVKRTSLVRGVLRTLGEPYLVWAMPEARCAERDDHCARRATGVAAYDKGANQLPTPRWLAGHPVGRIDRSLRIDADGHVNLLALSQDASGIELRRFQLGKEPPTAADAPPAEPELTLPVSTASAHAAALLGSGDALVLVYAQPQSVAPTPAGGPSVPASIQAHVLELKPDAVAIDLPSVDGEAPWIVDCAGPQARWVAYGGKSSGRLVLVAADGSVAEASHFEGPLGAVLHSENPALDRVRLACDEHGARFVRLEEAGSLWLTACQADGHCEPAAQVASQVASFAVLPLESGTLLAWSGLANAREIRVLRTDATGKPEGSPRTPATCWDPYGGFCGIPTLSRDGARVVLAAREGNDLLAIESSDDGKHFVALSGVQVGRALDASAHDPLQQHRIRKGID